MNALLLIAHGSRLQQANDDLRTIARRIRERGDYAVVEPGFLELAAPDIPAAARNCVAQGATRIVMLPYFLSAGVHVRRDLEQARAAIADAHAVDVRLAQPIGLHPLMLDILQDRAREAENRPG